MKLLRGLRMSKIIGTTPESVAQTDKGIIAENSNFRKFDISILEHRNSKTEAQASGYKLLCVKSTEELIKAMNTYHCVFATLKDGKRDDNSVLAQAPVIKLDVDAEGGALEEVLDKLKDYEYAMTPSQSNKDYKAHIIVLCDGDADNRKAGYQTQVDIFLQESGIDISLLDSKPLYSPSGYLAPASCGEELTVQTAREKSRYNQGTKYELVDLKAQGIVIADNESTNRGLLKGLKTIVDGNVLVKDTKSSNVNVLEKESIIYYYGRAVSVEDVKQAILDVRDTHTIYGGFSCPIANPEHTMDLVKTPYSFAFISHGGENGFGGDVVFKCSGNACSHTHITIIDNFEESNPNHLFILNSGKYVLLSKDEVISDDISPTAIKRFARQYDLTFKDDNNKEQIVEPTPITEVVYKVDYFNNVAMKWEHQKNKLTVSLNPTKLWDVSLELDEEVIKDYTQRVLNGKLDDILRIVFWSIKFNVDKLNKLLLFGGSNKGKTKLASLMGFFEMTAVEFHETFGEKQKKAHKNTIQKIRECGLIHADDIQSHIPENVKSLKDTARIDSMYGGVVEIPTKFLLISSTNDEITSTMNDEWANRLLAIDILDDGYDVTTSPVAKEKHNIYENHCAVYIQKRIIEILAEASTITDLEKLQKRYRLDVSTNERGEVIGEVRQTIALSLLHYLGDEVVYHESKPYVKKLKNVNDFIKSVLKTETRDMYISNFNKELSQLKKHFTGGRTSLRINGEPVPHYPLQNIIEVDGEEEF